MASTLHIIEPTLQDQAGHCYGYVKSLIDANHTKPLFDLHLWANRRSAQLFEGDPITVHPVYRRKTRKLQHVFILKKCLAKDQPIFIPTAGQTDLRMLDKLCNGKQQVFLHFHQYRQKPKKLAQLSAIAKRHPEFHIMAPTTKLLETFKQAGFKQCIHVPCPVPPHASKTQPKPFEKLIYAGAVREDKGFVEIIDFIEYCVMTKQPLPIECQTSRPHSGKLSNLCEQALAKLNRLNPTFVKQHRETFSQTDFQHFFQGAICLLAYDREQYRDKFSGVALEAFYAGVPLITVKDTWTGEQVEQFDAGIALDDRQPESIFKAAQHIIKHYEQYQNNSLNAAETLKKQHDPRNTLIAIHKALGGSA